MTTQEQHLTVSQAPAGALDVPDAPALKAKLTAIANFQTLVRASLRLGHDYGIIPGTGTKPTLLKPGAEKIAKLLSLADEYLILDKAEDWKTPFFRYMVKCQLRHIGTGIVVSEGLGECNSMETKYHYRWCLGSDVPAHLDKTKLLQQKRRSRKTGKELTMYRLDNEDIYSQVNTILKMAKKRSQVDATLSAGRLSDMFTQDIEDLAQHAATADPDTGEIQEDGEMAQVKQEGHRTPPVAVAPTPAPAPAKQAVKPPLVGPDEGGHRPPQVEPTTKPHFASLDDVYLAANEYGLGPSDCIAVWKVAFSGSGMSPKQLPPDVAWQELVNAGKVPA